jgi:hypothetical protein
LLGPLSLALGSLRGLTSMIRERRGTRKRVLAAQGSGRSHQGPTTEDQRAVAHSERCNAYKTSEEPAPTPAGMPAKGAHGPGKGSSTHRQESQEVAAAIPRTGCASRGKPSRSWGDFWLWYWACVIKRVSDFPFFPNSFPRGGDHESQEASQGLRSPSRVPAVAGLDALVPRGAVRRRTGRERAAAHRALGPEVGPARPAGIGRDGHWGSSAEPGRSQPAPVAGVPPSGGPPGLGFRLKAGLQQGPCLHPGEWRPALR